MRERRQTRALVTAGVVVAAGLGLVITTAVESATAGPSPASSTQKACTGKFAQEANGGVVVDRNGKYVCGFRGSERSAGTVKP